MSTEQRERLEQAANAGFDALAVALGGALQGVTPWDGEAGDTSSQLTAVLGSVPVSLRLSIDGDGDAGAEPEDLTRAFLEAAASSLGVDLTEAAQGESEAAVTVAWQGSIDGFVVTVHWTQEFVSDAAPSTPAPPEENGAVDAPGVPETAAAVEAGTGAAGPRLGRLAAVMLDVSVELGRTRIPIKDLLSLDHGGVVKLGKALNEPVDLVVNGMTTARGEMVVVDGRLGLRVTELID